MITVEIDDKTPEGKELLIEINKRSNVIRKVFTRNQNGVPEGYMNAQEWRSRCRKNISEIFRKNEHGISYMI